MALLQALKLESCRIGGTVMPKEPSHNSQTGERRAPAVVADWITSIVLAVASTGLFALLDGGLRAQTFVVAGLCTAMSLLVARRHGGVSAYARELRQKPNDLPPR